MEDMYKRVRGIDTDGEGNTSTPHQSPFVMDEGLRAPRWIQIVWLGFFPHTKQKTTYSRFVYMDQTRSKKIAHQGQMTATAFEGQGVQTTSRGHSNTCFIKQPWSVLADMRHGRRNTCNTQQSPEGVFLSVSDTHRAAHNTKEDFHSSFSSFSKMHAAAHTILPCALSQCTKKERVQQKETLSPPLFIQPITLSNGEGKYWMINANVQ